MITGERILEETESLNRYLDRLYHETESLNQARSALQFAEADILSVGVAGKNAKIRKANLMLATAAQRDVIAEIQQSIDSVRLAIDKSRNVLSAFKMIVRLMSVD